MYLMSMRNLDMKRVDFNEDFMQKKINEELKRNHEKELHIFYKL